MDELALIVLLILAAVIPVLWYHFRSTSISSADLLPGEQVLDWFEANYYLPFDNRIGRHWLYGIMMAHWMSKCVSVAFAKLRIPHDDHFEILSGVLYFTNYRLFFRTGRINLRRGDLSILHPSVTKCDIDCRLGGCFTFLRVTTVAREELFRISRWRLKCIRALINVFLIEISSTPSNQSGEPQPAVRE